MKKLLELRHKLKDGAQELKDEGFRMGGSFNTVITGKEAKAIIKLIDQEKERRDLSKSFRKLVKNYRKAYEKAKKEQVLKFATGGIVCGGSYDPSKERPEDTFDRIQEEKLKSILSECKNDCFDSTISHT